MNTKKVIPVLFNDLAFSSTRYKKHISQSVQQVILSGQFINGVQTAKLEKAMSLFFNAGELMTVASGHDALLLTLASFHLNKDDEIIYPVNAYPTAFPVCLSSGKPIGVDCDENGQIDSNDLQKKITKKTKVVILVHLYGLATDVARISALCRVNNIVLVEDCAQSFGSKFRNKYVGTWGDVGCFSFYPTKNIATFGDGGAILTRDKKIHDYVSQAKSYGEVNRYESEFVSGHSRMSEIQASILSCIFENRKSLFKSRKDLYGYYAKKISSLKLQRDIRLLQSHVDSDFVPHLIVVEANRRDELRNYLTKLGIETMIHYPRPTHLIPAFRYLDYQEGDFPMAERLSNNILSLPFYPFMKRSLIDRIIETIHIFYG